MNFAIAISHDTRSAQDSRPRPSPGRTSPSRLTRNPVTALRPSRIPAEGGLVLQRCNGAQCPPGTCGHQDDTELMRSAVAPGPDAVPSSVDSVLRSPGNALDPTARRHFELRFGHDFSEVRVHHDARAAASARAVNAIAYTVGHDVVFDAGRYAPETQRGRQLLAHELTHVLQQRMAPPNAAEGLTISRVTDPAEREADAAAAAETQETRTPALNAAPAAGSIRERPPVVRQSSAAVVHRWEACGRAEDCPPREAGEIGRAATAGLQIGTLNGTDLIVSGFPVNSSDVSNLSANSAWTSWCGSLASGSSRFEILGFSDCQGGVELNTELRRMRAMNVSNALPASARANTDGFTAAGLTDCVTANDTEANRSLNRSVVFHQTVTSVSFEPDVVTVRQCPPTDQTTAASLDEYRSLVLCAEKQTGLGPREMLTLLRQLYYGKPWSGVSTTNKWDNVIPCSPNIGNPEGRLGTNLFHALRDRDEIGGVDIGHIWTGLESMTCPSAAVSFFGGLGTVAMSNEAFATWGGDLGAAVAAFVACPQMGADAAKSDDCGKVAGSQPLSFYLGISAPDQDLEGDIDAFVIRAASLGIPCTGSAGQVFSPTKPMSEILLDYFGAPGTALGTAAANRYQCFVEAIGGLTTGKHITNSAAIRGPGASSVASFANAFYTKILGFPHTPDIGERLTMLAQSDLAVDWFLAWLEHRL